MNVTRLRTMTERSQMNFGKYRESSVSQVIDVDKYYLQWVYYNSSKINFVDSVLNTLGITQELRIDKPGTSKDGWIKFQSRRKLKAIKAISEKGDWKEYHAVRRYKKVDKLKNASLRRSISNQKMMITFGERR